MHNVIHTFGQLHSEEKIKLSCAEKAHHFPGCREISREEYIAQNLFPDIPGFSCCTLISFGESRTR